MVESLRLRGRYVDMQLHDDLDDSWMLMRAATKEVLVIGSRTQIMNEYDQTERTGIIKDYKKKY